MFEKLKARITSMNSSHPLARQRAEFLALKPDVGLEKKAHYTHDIVGAAAAYEAFELFQKHEAHESKLGQKITHARSKEIIVGLAEGRVVKLVEEKRLPFASEKEKVKFIGLAQKDAVRDAKRAIRESGMYEPHELEPIDNDEKHAAKIF
ncbi:hypothetical protein I317_00772 [Kwoniella heveanensis CBS 569]|uniref:CipC-like antibiotic response protein n=1 Tax=Kwoniella heveanensis BCC8398 TaxID=1296120 RepID=A0A1B9GP80_9TREE|nr:hypothetical protein I316_05536 [Kwoniella heveanensis BCC8398]OCF45250.1 hypothetical protein I317_00772 [Kwoniella heveanensis CBS 569]